MAKQKLHFAELYRSNKAAVERTLNSLWCGETKNESQASYVNQLQQIIKDIFAPQNAIPLVECMNRYESVHSVSADDAKKIVGGLWIKDKPPYEHQYKCWDTLLNGKTDEGKPKSICVTTGTGSGKTECFMLPLVHDLTQVKKFEQTQALFLYPLNALMEDQKERMEEILETAEKTTGVHLTFVVYNSDLPEDARDIDTDEHKRRKIEDIRGIERDEKGRVKTDENGEPIVKYKHLIYTREQLRQTPANILLTNPTMLEYILLRSKDSKITASHYKDSEGNIVKLESLRWVAIDETHTYGGAGAAELAMLLRRVIQAFDVEAENIRFATSSATLGNGPKEEEQLRKFIADITGLKEKQVAVIGGVRKGIDQIPDDENAPLWHKIVEDKTGYIPLNELFPGEKRVEDMLSRLDKMCDGVPASSDLKVKVHYFYRIPNNGLYVQLTQYQDGSFKVLTEAPISDEAGGAPYIELSRCKHCGEYVAIAEVDQQKNTYQPITMDDSDMFDIGDDNDNSPKKKFVFALTNKQLEDGDNNACYTIIGDRFSETKQTPGEWTVVGNTHCCCPYCGSKFTKQSKQEDEEIDTNEEQDEKKLNKFRISSDFVSRIIAPSILNQLVEREGSEGNVTLHKGQQYISFVDSRQGAAKATMGQNLEEESLWVYSSIFHELCKRAKKGSNAASEIAKQEAIVNSTTATMAEKMAAFKKMEELQSKGKQYLTWMDITELLSKDEMSDVFCRQFAKRSQDSEELDKNGNVKPEVKARYIQSIMVGYLGKRPKTASSPETMGLFTPFYENLEPALKEDLPASVQRFNHKINSDTNRISKKDWHDLMQIFIDYTLRSNESVFLQIPGNNIVDIFSCVRFATQKEKRRSARKPTVKDKNNRSRIIRYLGKILVDDGQYDNIEIAIIDNAVLLQDVINDLWQKLLDYTILEHSTHLKKDGTFEKDKDEIKKDKDGNEINYGSYRMNFIRMGFKLYKHVSLCDSNTSDDIRHTACLRPVETTFKGYSPYLKDNLNPVIIENRLKEEWKAFPYYKGSVEGLKSTEIVSQWAIENRKLLWQHNLWGDNGVFATHLEKTYTFPDLFVQAEHTAQVDKMISRKVQKDFKNHDINILACSTTMEMGVDLGDLEVVMLTSVPPQPSNYKQRAGRSGRNNYVRSACITLCGSDSVGLRTLYHPIENIITRKVPTPYVDLNSAQVIQRHINAFLIRYFGVFAMGDHAGSISQKVVDYYTNYAFQPRGRNIFVYKKVDNSPVGPNDGLGDYKGTPYEIFNSECSKCITPELRKELEYLLRDTIFDSRVQHVVDKAREANERCYRELELLVDDIKLSYINATSDKQRNFFTIKYIEPLANQLLSFWATNRFTPNANMPVNVVSFDVNTNNSLREGVNFNNSSNPSYPLKEALSQYAPGNSVVIDGRVSIVRGIRYTDFFKRVVTFKRIYRNDEQTAVDNPAEIPNPIVWPVSQTIDLELLQPTEFIPDVNESENRIISNNVYTRVNAQLIGASDWPNIVTEPHLFAARSNRESGNAKILYYNEGIGFGYCHCTKCGRTVLEQWAAATAKHPERLPSEMNNIEPDDDPKFHFNLIKKGYTYKDRCIGCNMKDSIHRNVILGDLIQTDYTEIKIRHIGQNWINRRTEENQNLLITLGVLLSQSLADILGKDRTAVDFTITPNGHICVFDTNPGGSGYANQLSEIHILREAIRKSMEIILIAEETKSKDVILDKFSQHYLRNINIQAAKEWIEEENNNVKKKPKEVEAAFPSINGVSSVEETSLAELQRAYAKSSQTPYLFVDNDYNTWDYGCSEYGWRGHLLNHFANKDCGDPIFCILKNNMAYMNEPIKDMAQELSTWVRQKTLKKMKNPYTALFPLAYINGCLYFTNSKEHASLNDHWGNGTMYIVRTDIDFSGLETVDCKHSPKTIDIKLLKDDNLSINTRDLGELIHNRAKNTIDDFIEYCKHSNDPINILYQDEHLKSVLAMVLTLHTIEYFAKAIGRNFSLEFRVEKYEDYSAKEGIVWNLRNSSKRNRMLNDLASEWVVDVLRSSNRTVRGTVAEVISHEKRTLTHWRELTITCGDKHLTIYPDGGFINGWHLDGAACTRIYKNEDTTTADNLPIYLGEDIKIEVTTAE